MCVCVCVCVCLGNYEMIQADEFIHLVVKWLSKQCGCVAIRASKSGVVAHPKVPIY